MANNFLDIHTRVRAKQWPYAISVLLFVLIVGVMWTWYAEVPVSPPQQDFPNLSDERPIPSPPESSGLPVSLVPVTQPTEDGQQIGGDVTIAPPEHVPQPLPELTGVLPDPDMFSAKVLFVKDQETGKILYGKNEYTERPIASITKLMSALVLLEQGIDWRAQSVVSPDDVSDSHMYAGEQYTREDLWRAALVGSSNKAILTLADSTGWTREDFVARMNEKSLELGMTDTHFEEPTGLNVGNVSTAADVSILLEESLRFNEISQAVLEPEHTLHATNQFKTHHMWSTNWLLLGWVTNQLEDFRGGKTGYIPQSGYNFSMQLADEEGHVIDVVVFGAANNNARFSEARDIANAVFENYTWPKEEESAL